MNINFRLNRIARAIAAAGYLQNIDSEMLKHCKETMKKCSDETDLYVAHIFSNSGNSYDGYMSFTEGDATCAFYVDGWTLMDYFQEEFDEYEQNCRESFIWDNQDLYEKNGIDTTDKKALADKVLDDETPEEIRNAYENYETKWMSDDYGYIAIEIQFHNNGDGDGLEDYDVNVYGYLADTYMKNKKYFYEESFNLADGNGNPYELVDKEIKKAFKSIA